MNERRKTGTLQKENTRENPYRRFDRFHFSLGANDPPFEIFKCKLELYPELLYSGDFLPLAIPSSLPGLTGDIIL